MKDHELLPAVAFGLIVGLLGQALISKQLFTPDGLLNAGVTLLVGWLIQRRLRDRGELDRIPIESVIRVTQRIEHLVSACIGCHHATLGNDPSLLQNLRLMSNEVHWLQLFVAKLEIDDVACRQLFKEYHELKGHLTSKKTVNLPAAAEASRRMQLTLISVQWQISRQLQQNPSDFSRLD